MTLDDWLNEVPEADPPRNGEPVANERAADDIFGDVDNTLTWEQLGNDFKRQPNSTEKATYDGDLMEFGREAELLVIASIKAKGLEVKDVTKDTNWQKLSVDLLMVNKNGQISVEVKRDSIFLTDGPFVELGRIYHNVEPNRFWYEGWTSRSTADFLVWVDVESRKLYPIDFNVFRKIIQAYVAKTRPNITVIVHSICEDFTTFGFRIPWNEIDPKVGVIDVRDNL